MIQVLPWEPEIRKSPLGLFAIKQSPRLVQKDGIQYRFYTNTSNFQLNHIDFCCQKFGGHPLFLDTAYDMSGKKIAGYSSVYFPENEWKDSVNLLDELEHKIAEVNKKKLAEEGYPVNELQLGQLCYLGCEQEYWPNYKGQENYDR